MEEKRHFVELTKEEIELKREKRAQKTKNKILTEIYKSDKKMNMYEIQKKVRGKPSSAVYEQILDLLTKGMITIEKTVDGSRKKNLVGLTARGINDILEDTEEGKYQAVAIYFLGKLVDVRLKSNKTNLNLLKDKSTLNVISKLKELGLIEQCNDGKIILRL